MQGVRPGQNYAAPGEGPAIQDRPEPAPVAPSAAAGMPSASAVGPAWRTVHVRMGREDPRAPADVADNAVRTTKYLHNPVTAMPKELFFQFRRVFNIFWLIQCIIVLIPGLAPFSPVTTIGGFGFVLGVTLIKDFYEDYQRLKADHSANSQPVSVLRNGEFEQIESWRILVGDVVRVKDGEAFSVDLAVLVSSDPSRLCLVETSNLDGERNLKRYFAMSATAHLTTTAALHAELQATILVDQPNDKLYSLSGQLRMNTGTEVSAVTADNVCLRGSKLKQTDWVIGVAVYAGMESKIQMNAMEASAKFPSMERALNRYINFLFVFIIVAALLLTVGTISLGPVRDNHFYLGATEDLSAATFCTYLVLLNAFIPLSMIVTLDVAILCQSLFMMWDDDMRTAKGPMVAYTSSLNSELGQIEYVFSDKTGTLTKNEMHFKLCSIAGTKYVDPMSGEVGRAAGLQHATAGAGGREGSQMALEYLRALTICNDVVPQKLDDGAGGSARGGEGAGIKYQSASPDETALVEASCANRVVLTRRDKDAVEVVEGSGTAGTYHILATLPFTSDRRRMSVVVKTPQGEHVVYSKGADMVMVPLCKPGEEAVLQTTVAHLEEFSAEGLRALVVARRALTPQEAQDLCQAYEAASQALDGREELLTQVYATVERELECLGATAVEDQLQDNVPQTVQFLLRAGLHVWILTGDKLATAMTIAYSSSILTAKMAVAVVDALDHDAVASEVAAAIELQPLEEGKALVIGGAALALVMAHNQESFVRLCEVCNVVVCARCAPVQKADVVTLVMKKLNKVSLAIGDGGNDVPMILSAHVGVGIEGNEGMQAARSSDYAVGEFQKLQKLLAVHGRYCSLRISDLIKYSFYKNVAFCLPQVVFAIYNLFSGSTIHNEVIILLFNMSMTGLPILFHTIFEKDVDESLLYAWPQLYSTPERKNPLSVREFLLWEGHALFQGGVMGFLLLFGTGSGSASGGFEGQSAFDPSGRPSSADELGFILSTAVFIAVTAKLMLLTRSWTVIPVSIISLCVVVYFILLAVMNWMFCSDGMGEYSSVSSCGIMFTGVLSNANAILLILLVVAMSMVLDISIAYCVRTFSPFQWQVVQETSKRKIARVVDEAGTLS